MTTVYLYNKTQLTAAKNQTNEFLQYLVLNNITCHLSIFEPAEKPPIAVVTLENTPENQKTILNYLENITACGKLKLYQAENGMLEIHIDLLSTPTLNYI